MIDWTWTERDTIALILQTAGFLPFFSFGLWMLFRNDDYEEDSYE